jgi:hypothetical protein
MNTLERSLVEKDGYDNGWEVVVSRDESLFSMINYLP